MSDASRDDHTDHGAGPRVAGTRRPHANLLKYWALQSILLGPFFPLLLVPRFFKFRTLTYRFDDEGVSASWGVLFRREISLNYSRIQDIHLASNVVERWLGLARIQIQTASGASGAEMTVEGIREYEEVRDWLYSRMRGARRRSQQPRIPDAAGPTGAENELAETLREVADELRRVRELLEDRAPIGAPGARQDS